LPEAALKPCLQLPTTISLQEILSRSAQFFFYMVVQVIVVHNCHMLFNGDV